MAGISETFNIEDLQLSDGDSTDALFDPPPTRTRKLKDYDATNTPTKPTSAPARVHTESRYSTEEAREAALQHELENVRKINKVIEDVVESLEKAKNNMETVSRTVANASTLLNTWTRILSQTEHNQRLILNRNWHGATQDLADIEADALAEQQAAERRALEAQARKEAAARRVEEEKRKAEAAAKGSRSVRGRARGAPGTSRFGAANRTGQSASGTSYVGVGGHGGRGKGSTSGSRAGSGIGRGFRRGRGLG